VRSLNGMSFGAGNEVWTPGDDMESIAVGDLDNDGTPFAAVWSQNDVEAITSSVDSVSIVKTSERGST
jgi:hypothetical protein